MKALISKLCCVLALSLLVPVKAGACEVDLKEVTQSYNVAGEMTIGDILFVKGYCDYLQDIPEVVVIAAGRPENRKAVILYAFECPDGWHCYTYGEFESGEGFGYAQAPLGEIELQRLHWLRGILFAGNQI